MSEEHKISPFFKRRLDHHKFEKMMRSGISYMYFESKNLEQFKYKLVKATLENYIHYKYNLDIENLPKDDVDNFIDYMIETYDALLKMYYYNERKIRGGTNENYNPAKKENIYLKESIDKSEDKKLKFVTKIIHEFFNEVSFIEIKKYQNKPLIRVYFDNDGDASNEESYFAEQIQDKIYQYTGIKLLPYWQLEQYSTDSDFRLDAIKLKYDDEGNVINESEENKKEKNSNYLEMIRELIEPFKKEDCVCNIKVSFDNDMYDIYLEFGTEELNDKFYSSVGKNHYVKNLKNNVKNTIKNYLSIDNLYVGSYGTPRCGWTKN